MGDGGHYQLVTVWQNTMNLIGRSWMLQQFYHPKAATAQTEHATMYASYNQFWMHAEIIGTTRDLMPQGIMCWGR